MFCFDLEFGTHSACAVINFERVVQKQFFSVSLLFSFL